MSKLQTFGRTTYPTEKLTAQVVVMVSLYEKTYRGKVLHTSIVTEDGELLRLLACALPMTKELFESNQKVVCVQTYQDHNGIVNVADILPVNIQNHY